jgi:hypothetical protein
MPQDMTRRQRHQMKGKAMNPTMRCHDSRLLAGLLGGRAMRDLDIRLAGRWIEGFLILLDSCLILFIVRLGSSGLLTLLRSLCHSMTRATRTTWHVLLRPCPPHPHPCQQSHLQRLPYLSRPLLLSRGRLPRLMMVSALARLPPGPSRAIMRRRLQECQYLGSRGLRRTIRGSAARIGRCGLLQVVRERRGMRLVRTTMSGCESGG